MIIVLLCFLLQSLLFKAISKIPGDNITCDCDLLHNNVKDKSKGIVRLAVNSSC